MPCRSGLPPPAGTPAGIPAGVQPWQRHGARAAAGPVGGRPRCRPPDLGPQARVAAGAGHDGRRLPRAPARHPGPRPRHRVRGGRLPEHLRVLVRRHRHLHDQRVAVHPGLWLLPGGHAPPDAARRRGARPGRRGSRSDGPGPRRHHLRGPRRPARRRRRERSPRRSAPCGAASPGTAVEVLISDVKGDRASLRTILDARPDVLNHNIETVARLQRAVRPSAGYARSLTVLARSAAAGLTTKSGIILGMGEREDEVIATLADLRAVGVDIVTLGQYLRPSTKHLPVARWWRPDEFDDLRRAGEALGFAHVQSSPLTRSSYHAREAAGAPGRRCPGTGRPDGGTDVSSARPIRPDRTGAGADGAPRRRRPAALPRSGPALADRLPGHAPRAADRAGPAGDGRPGPGRARPGGAPGARRRRALRTPPVVRRRGPGRPRRRPAPTGRRGAPGRVGPGLGHDGAGAAATDARCRVGRGVPGDLARSVP